MEKINRQLVLRINQLAKDKKTQVQTQKYTPKQNRLASDTVSFKGIVPKNVVKSFTKNSSDITIPVVQFYGQDAIEMKEDWGMNAENQLSIHPEYLILLNRGQPEEDVENLESIL